MTVILLALTQLVNAGEKLRIMTFNAEWLVYTEDETTKDPWGPEYTLYAERALRACGWSYRGIAARYSQSC